MDPASVFRNAAKNRPIDVVVLNKVRNKTGGLPGAPWATLIHVSTNHIAPPQRIFSLLLDSSKEKGIAILYPKDKKPLTFANEMHNELVLHLRDRIAKFQADGKP